MKNPHIKTELPGPKARLMLARDSAVVSPSYPRDYPFVMSHGRGTEVWDVDGNRFLDFVAGIAVCSTGHAHPQVVAAITEAAELLMAPRRFMAIAIVSCASLLIEPKDIAELTNRFTIDSTGSTSSIGIGVPGLNLKSPRSVQRFLLTSFTSWEYCLKTW